MANYNVFKDKETRHWAAKKQGTDRVSAFADTQKEAEALAKQFSATSGGGEVTIHGRDGRIRDRDTVAPGNDPSPPRDTKH